MHRTPDPLPAGTLLGERFEIRRTLGRGGFGIAYLADDLLRRDQVVVKELAPSGVGRSADGILELDALGAATAHRLRRRFLEEAKLLARLNVAGVPNVRAFASEGGSAYYVAEYIADAEPLDAVLARERRLEPAGALDVVMQLVETLDAVHAKGILHRDLKPSNVLLRRTGEAYLIDFGAAREWHADMTDHQTVLFTPGFAPLEQLSERARRGPATDVYGLCALAYTLLAGVAPVAATDRVNGVPLTPLRQLRPELDLGAARAIERGLALRYEERPQTIAAFRALLAGDADEPGPATLAELDDRLYLLERLSVGKRQCPSCSGFMHDPRPIPRGRCPVCARGRIRPRDVDQRLCPACRAGRLVVSANEGPLCVCPVCALGALEPRKKGLLARAKSLACAACRAEFEEREAGVELVACEARPEMVGRVLDWPAWRAETGRAAEVVRCDGCDAQFDVLRDGQWRQVSPKPKASDFGVLYPEEWARVAARLDPGCGTHACDACEADYFVDGDRVTLLGAHEDPFGFAERHAGRPLAWEALAWLGAGKSSPRPGLACRECGTEFDAEERYLRLVRTDHPVLSQRLDQLQTLEDWRRIALDLPLTCDEAAFEESIDLAVVDAYRAGELEFDDKGTLWRGPAARLEPEAGTGALTLAGGELAFGGVLRRQRIPLEAVARAEPDGDRLVLRLKGEREPVVFEIEELEFTARLKSGDRTVVLGAADLAARLERAAREAESTLEA